MNARRPSAGANLLTSGHIAAKALRFAAVGLLSGAIYAIVTSVLVARLGWAPVPASVVGYCVSVPASFLGHRRFSFRSDGHWTAEAVRFVLAQAVNMTVTAGSMHAALRWLGSNYVWGMFAALILVPIANFLFMNLWVFTDQAERRGR
ncbi:MAG TPA: GtrA family protein [Haliangium sp.]|nr:GtrA family protein [Haliangium sp.]